MLIWWEVFTLQISTSIIKTYTSRYRLALPVRHSITTVANKYLKITPDVKEPHEELEQLKEDNTKLTLRIKEPEAELIKDDKHTHQMKLDVILKGNTKGFKIKQ